MMMTTMKMGGDDDGDDDDEDDDDEGDDDDDDDAAVSANKVCKNWDCLEAPTTVWVQLKASYKSNQLQI